MEYMRFIRIEILNFQCLSSFLAFKNSKFENSKIEFRYSEYNSWYLHNVQCCFVLTEFTIVVFFSFAVTVQ